MTHDRGAFRIEVLLSFQRALWDLVTPGLRAVAVRPTYPRIEARFMSSRSAKRSDFWPPRLEPMLLLTSRRLLMSDSTLLFCRRPSRANYRKARSGSTAGAKTSRREQVAPSRRTGRL